MLKLRVVDVATSFHLISSRSTWQEAHKNSSKLGNIVLWRLLSKEMFANSLKLFGSPTTKWWPWKIFGKLNRNNLLMANIFKLHGYQTFGLMKIQMLKICFPNKIFSVKKFGLRLVGRQKWYFLFFAFFSYPNFKNLSSKIL